jgi:hypothetical protein
MVIGVSQRIKNSNVEADHDRGVKNAIFKKSRKYVLRTLANVITLLLRNLAVLQPGA